MLAGKAARNCASGCTRSAMRGRRPIHTPIGTQIRVASAISTTTRSSVISTPSRNACRHPPRRVRVAMKRRSAKRRGRAQPARAPARPRSAQALASRVLTVARHGGGQQALDAASARKALPTRLQQDLRSSARAPEQRRAPRTPAALRRRGLLDPELVGPGNQRPEQQLVVDQDDHAAWSAPPSRPRRGSAARSRAPRRSRCPAA